MLRQNAVGRGRHSVALAGGQRSTEPEEAMESYLHFNVSAADAKLAEFFGALQQQQADLGVADIQVGMSSLEDVFLTIAREAEAEEAQERGVKEKVKLRSGEDVEVILGSEEETTSPKGVKFRVTWTQNAEGKLVVASIIEPDEEAAAEEAFAPCDDNIVSVPNDGSEAPQEADRQAARGRHALSSERLPCPVHSLVRACARSLLLSHSRARSCSHDSAAGMQRRSCARVSASKPSRRNSTAA